MFPAYAGMDRSISVQWISRVPRLRGDDPIDAQVDVHLAKCSPPTRCQRRLKMSLQEAVEI